MSDLEKQEWTICFSELYFITVCELKLELVSANIEIGAKLSIFHLCDLKKQKGTSSMPLEAMGVSS